MSSDDTENGDIIMGSSSGKEGRSLADAADGSSEVDPYVGMEFESDEAARHFYDLYAIRVGFVIRIHCSRRSQDGTIDRYKLVCNKQGFRRSSCSQIKKRKARPDTRQGCKAGIAFVRVKSGKWVVTKFVEEHNHQLAISSVVHGRGIVLLSQASDEKDAKIQELTAELQRERKRSAAYLQQLEMVLQDMEEHSGYLSRNIDDIVQNVLGIELRRGVNNNLQQ